MGTLKLNYDAAVSPDGKVGLAGAGRNHQGEVKFVAASSFLAG